MAEGFAVIFFMLVVIVVAAIAVIVGLALVRRPADQWQTHLREQNAQFQAPQETDPAGAVDPRDTTLDDLLDANAVEKNAYFDANRLPGIDRIEVVTDRIEAMQENRRAAKHGDADPLK